MRAGIPCCSRSGCALLSHELQRFVKDVVKCCWRKSSVLDRQNCTSRLLFGRIEAFNMSSSCDTLRHPPPGDPAGVAQALTWVQVVIPHTWLSPPDPQPSRGNFTASVTRLMAPWPPGPYDALCEELASERSASHLNGLTSCSPPIAPAFLHQFSVLCPIPLVALLDMVLPGNCEFYKDDLGGL